MGNLGALQDQAAKGDAQARTQLAYLLLTGGAGLVRSVADALQLVEAACAQGHANAMVLHAVLAMRGVGRAKSLDDAYRLIRQAAALGHDYSRRQLPLLGQDVLDREPWTKPIKLDQLADAPRVCVAEAFIPRSICNWLIECAASKLQSCTVFDPRGGGMRDPARTNTAAGLHLLEGDLIQQLVCRRIAIATGLPLVNQERMNILHYAPGQEYKPHYDFVRPDAPEAQGYAGEIAAIGQRVVTVLIYLNDRYEGGETVFPRLKLRFKGRAGDALIFWNVSQTGALERDSLHAGAPVTAGEKWLLSQWMREKAYPLI